MTHARALNADTLKQSIVIGLGLTVVCRLAGFARGVVLARTLEPADLGLWALMVGAIEIVAFVLLLGTPAGLSRYLERHRQRGTLRWITFRGCSVVLAAALLACLAAALVWQPLGAVLFSERSSQAVVFLTLAAILATVVFSLAQGVLYGLRLFRLNSVLELLQNIGFLALVSCLLIFTGGGVTSVGIAHVSVTLFAALMVSIWVYRRLSRNDDAPESRRQAGVSADLRILFAFALGSWTFGSLQRLCRGIDRYMLLHLSDLSSEETLAQISEYFISLRLCAPIAIVAAAIAGVLLPHAAQRWETGRHEEVRSMILLAAKVAMFGMSIAAAALVLMKEWFFEILIGYVPASADAIFAIVLLSIVVVAFSAIVRTYLLCRERVWCVAAIWFAAFALNGLLNILLIPPYGLWGAVTATTTSVALAAIAILLQANRDGLAMDFGTCACSFLPLVILLPPAPCLVVLSGAVVSACCSNGVFSSDEKQVLFGWFGRRPSGKGYA